MKLILSPTKTMASPGGDHQVTTPAFAPQADYLIQQLHAMEVSDLATLLKTSDALTQKTREQIEAFGDAPSHPAILTFRGEAFKSLGASDFSPEDLAFAQAHLIILSGLYGVLAPMDGIRPHRLDFNTPLAVEDGRLKAFWKKRLVPWFQERVDPREVILDLASREYASILDGSPLASQIIHFQFRERRGDRLKNISVRAKQARGAFARYIIQQGLDSPAPLKSVIVDGYAYHADLSCPGEWFFIRD